ncbi:MAG: glycosyltransferase family 4 protein [Planctomycetes bacterium]|nr:glycosyltransferase family 4 protein [Planctomycetota bacterium]
MTEAVKEDKGVCIFTMTLRTGGAERQVSFLAKELLKKGVRVHVVSYLPGGVFWDELSRINNPLLSLESVISKEPSIRLLRFLLLLFRAPRTVRGVLTKNSCSALYGSLMWGNIVVFLASLFSSVRLVWSIRSTMIQRSFKENFLLRLTRMVSGVPYAIISNSYEGKDCLSEYGYPGSSIQVIGNMIDADRFKFREDERGKMELDMSLSERPVLGVVSRIVPGKGLEVLFEALELISNTPCPKVIIAGGGEQSYKEELKKTWSHLPLIWLDSVEDIAPLYSVFDIVVHPSLSEAFPNTVLEAMACGRVVIATDVGDVMRIVSMKQRVCPPSDAVSLAGVIDAALKLSEDERIKEGGENRQKVITQYSPSKCVESYMKVFFE